MKGGEKQSAVMTLAEVEAIKKRSKSGGSGPWVSDFDEMAKKTAIRRHSKRLTLSPEFADALEKDDDKIDERAVSGRVVAREIPLDPMARQDALPPGAEDQQWGDETEGGAQ